MPMIVVERPPRNRTADSIDERCSRYCDPFGWLYAAERTGTPIGAGVVARLVVLSGVTGVDDPWHDFTLTSSVIAGILTEAGWSCDVVTTARSEQAGLAEADLLIVNSGRAARLGQPARSVGPVTGRRGTAEAPAALLSYLASGRPVLGIHAAADTFAAVPQWT